MNPKSLLRRIGSGAVANVSFSDMVKLAEAFGFELQRVVGSHHIYAHGEIPEQLNLQETGGQVKPYQVRQFLRLIERYALTWKGAP